MNPPTINVTPLIDVLLVLLIIFMVVAPIKPSAFNVRLPAENPPEGEPNPQSLAVIVNSDLSLGLNKETSLGTVDDPSLLIARLKHIFAERAASGDVSASFADSPDRPVDDRSERTVFIKAPRSMDYGSVARVVDSVKVAGAFPISLQIDAL